jgi:hypothetical protein
VERGEREQGRCGGGRRGSSLYMGAEGGQPVVKVEEWPTLMGMKWLALNWRFTLRIE